MVPLALFANLATRWHHLHWFQSWPPGNVTYIATLPWIALLALSVSIESVSSPARVTSVKFAQVAHWVRHLFETQADEDTNSILTDNASCASYASYARNASYASYVSYASYASYASYTCYASYRIYTEKVTISSSAIWWPNFQLMQVAPSGGQILN